MVEDRLYAVKYVGEGVRSVKGIGVFQHGTTVHLPAPEACKLAEDDDFVLEGNVAPARILRLRTGQLDPETRPPPSPKKLAEWEAELKEMESE
jgi:hypothetical protein